ncbi:hypothetical protein CK203_050822 [Vitis vinifera]|uniref:Transposon Ty3-I Gag-Pol polyprotein n=1 Tax=Vitis vinifera TaxID=29760 RepID=A0A438HBM0_VITVI|nr:hypothetical protein CK203_050822 [Vitis vinifera]
MQGEKQGERKNRVKKTEDSSCSLLSHFWSTFQSPFSTCYIPFQSSGSQESNASNRVQFGAEMRKLQPLEDDCSKLKEGFSKFHAAMEAKHHKMKANFAAVRNQPFVANFLASQSNSEDFSLEDERLSFLSLRVRKAGPTLGKASDFQPWRCTSLPFASLCKKFVFGKPKDENKEDRQKPRAQGQVFAMTHRDAQATSDVVIASYHAFVDCFGKRVMLSIPDQPYFSFEGKHVDKPLRMISTLRASSLLRKGCQGFLAYVVNEENDLKLEDIPIVRDYSDVFPNDLPDLPPEMEVEFTIDLAPGTAPISKAPYKMAPMELKELKIQLQELLDKGFIRPSVST